MCKSSERSAALTLANSELPPITSCLFHRSDSESLSSSMKRAILEVSNLYSDKQLCRNCFMWSSCNILAPVSRRLCFSHRFICLLLEYLNKVHSEFDELLRVDNLNGNYVLGLINSIIQVLCPEFAAVFIHKYNIWIRLTQWS